MQRLTVIALVLISSVALAQQAPPRPSDEEINARIQTLSAQRNTCQDQIVLLSGKSTAEINKLQAEIDALKKQIEESKPKTTEEKK